MCLVYFCSLGLFNFIISKAYAISAWPFLELLRGEVSLGVLGGQLLVQNDEVDGVK